jgi:hypothetical protein
MTWTRGRKTRVEVVLDMKRTLEFSPYGRREIEYWKREKETNEERENK